MFKRFLLPLDLQFFSTDESGGGGEGYFIDPEQLGDFELETDETVEFEDETVGDVEDEEIDPNSEENDGEELTDEQIQDLIDLGELGQVSLDEIKAWKNGTMMQADYTKKTTEVANMRKQLEQEFAPYKQLDQLFQNNPQLEQQFIAMLQGEEMQQKELQTQFDITRHPQFQKLNEELSGLKQFQSQFQEQQKQIEIQREWENVRTKYPDIVGKEEELATYADQNGLKLEQAYRDMYFDKIREETIKKTQTEMVKNNMKKKVAKTIKPQNPTGSNDKVIPDGGYESLVAYLSKQNLNLTD